MLVHAERFGRTSSGVRKRFEHETNDLGADRRQVGGVDSMSRKEADVHRVACLVEGVWIGEERS